jgi:ABC-type molybdate transport system substrate-binding protein
MPELLAAFQAQNPAVRKIFYETLPPGVLAQQIERGGLAIDGLTLQERGDVYLSGEQRMTKLKAEGLVGDAETYASNGLGIMVLVGNPLHIQSMRDLGRAGVRVAMPNPQTEGIARQIEASYRLAGGDQLDATIMKTKVADGTTVLTSIHHRQTPRWILDGKVDAGAVWMTEGLYQERIHSGIAVVPVPNSENVIANYQAGTIANAPHRAAATAFLAFLIGPRAQAIYRTYGFAAPR